MVLGRNFAAIYGGTKALFQFHYGAIGRALELAYQYWIRLFQFHYGAIGSNT